MYNAPILSKLHTNYKRSFLLNWENVTVIPLFSGQMGPTGTTITVQP